MKRMAHDHRVLLLLAGALVTLAGIAWGGAHRPRATAVASTENGNVVAAWPAPTVLTVPATIPATAPVTPTAIAVSETHGTPAPTGAAPVVAEAGMRIYRDPETGDIGMPGPEHMVTDANANQDVSDLKQVRLPDGSVMIDLQGRFQETMIMTIDAKGQRAVRCATDPKAADLKAPAAAPAPAQPSGREEQ